MDKSLDKSINKLLRLSKKELNKKNRIFKIKQEEKEEDDKIDLHVKLYLRNKEDTMKKRVLRMKSLRLAGEKKELSKDFDERYKQKEKQLFNKKWTKLSKQLKMNRVKHFLIEQKEKEKWDNEKYNNMKELLMYNMELNQLRNLIEYDENIGKIINCKLLE